ncbi:MAG: thrombospondin type-1 domain-containing protein [Patescibacteria group bacterium]|nr:thrombospondin type-1 domain-containing protein [Patescibacteria group bacterium]
MKNLFRLCGLVISFGSLAFADQMILLRAPIALADYPCTFTVAGDCNTSYGGSGCLDVNSSQGTCPECPAGQTDACSQSGGTYCRDGTGALNLCNYTTGCSCENVSNIGNKYYSCATGSCNEDYTCESNGGTADSNGNHDCTKDSTCGGSCGPMDGQCGSANNTYSSSQPSTNLCSIGAASPVSGGGGSDWTWYCSGVNGGSRTYCRAPSTALSISVSPTNESAAANTTYGAYNITLTNNTNSTLLNVSVTASGMPVSTGNNWGISDFPYVTTVGNGNTFNAGNLSPGTYHLWCNNGTYSCYPAFSGNAGGTGGPYSINFTASYSGGSASVSAGLTVNAPQLNYSPGSFNFTGIQGGNNPSNQILTITDSGNAALSWNLSANTNSGGNWLSIGSIDGNPFSDPYHRGLNSPGQSHYIGIGANISGLSGGTYSGQLILNSNDRNVTIPVTLTISVPVTYVWQTGSYSSCSVSCGGGTQTRNVWCQDSNGNTVSNSYCSGTAPTSIQTCNTQPCITYSWQAGAWGSCSVPCGGGTQNRPVWCQDSNGNTVSNSYCSGTAPTSIQTCNAQACTCTPNSTSSCGIAPCTGVTTCNANGSGWSSCDYSSSNGKSCGTNSCAVNQTCQSGSCSNGTPKSGSYCSGQSCIANTLASCAPSCSTNQDCGACYPVSFQSQTSGFSLFPSGPAQASITVFPDHTFYAFVDYGKANIDAIQTPYSGGYVCAFDNAWVGTAARFKCTAPGNVGSYTYNSGTTDNTSGSNICSSGPTAIGTLNVAGSCTPGDHQTCGTAPCTGTETCSLSGSWSSCDYSSSDGKSCSTGNACAVGGSQICSDGSCVGGTPISGKYCLGTSCVADTLSSCSPSCNSPIDCAPSYVVYVRPYNPTLSLGDTQQFTAQVDQITSNGHELASNQKIKYWEVNGVVGGDPADGTITSNGLYTAPSSVSVPNVVITAVPEIDPNISGSTVVYFNTPGDCTSFTANPGSVVPPQGSTLSWICTGVTSCTISGVSGFFGANGSTDVYPSVTTTYTLNCNEISGGTITKTTTVVAGSPGRHETAP